MCIEFDAKSKNNCLKNFCHRIQIIDLKKKQKIEISVTEIFLTIIFGFGIKFCTNSSTLNENAKNFT